MAYFLKKTNLKKGLYLQIYRSYYNAEKKYGSHQCYKTLGYVQNLIASGIDDPVAYYSAEVAKMNEEYNFNKQNEKSKLISSPNFSPYVYVGYFPIRSILNHLSVEKYFNIYGKANNFEFNLYKCMEALVYSRLIDPCSKKRTCQQVIPCLWGDYEFSYNQVLTCTEFLGANYEKFLEIFTKQVSEKYSIDTSKAYFDCTNYYFEIDQSDALRKKGPSKECRKDPIVGMGLLLDANCIPIGMKIYPGNESEKPVLRDVINSLKSRNHIEGRTIQVADKGLNCSTNILEAKKNGDGYIFSKSVKTLPEVEKTWVLLNKDYKVVHDENGKLKYTYKSCIDTFQYTYKDEYGKKRTASVREKRIVTYNPKLAKKHTMEIQRMVEKANSLTYSLAKKSEYGESAKYVKFASTDSDGNVTDEKIAVGINQEKIDEDLKLAGYNMLITSEVKMGAREIYETYHQLWRIEETFRVLKTDLEARPVYLQKEDSIKGHFLVCYIAVLLLRIFQFKVLENRYGSSQVIKFIQDFRVVKTSGIEIINLMNDSPLVREIAEKYKLPIMHASLTKTDIKKVLNSRIW